MTGNGSSVGDPWFVADHPFVFAIHNADGIYFAGRVTNFEGPEIVFVLQNINKKIANDFIALKSAFNLSIVKTGAYSGGINLATLLSV